MTFDEIHAHLEGIPFMEPSRARTLYQFIIENRISSCLELGFAHGVSSCYIAAALDELGTGHLTSVDLAGASEWQRPSIEELLQKTGLGRHVTVARERTSYTWFLKKKLEEQSRTGTCDQIYDFCFIDGPKHWTIDGCAFFLVDKLLKPNGWLLFDDFSWKYSQLEPEVSDGISVRTMGDDELNSAQIELVFRLLVMQHPGYSHFRIQDNWWAWAQKVVSADRDARLENTDHSVTVTPPLLGRLRRRLMRTIAGE